jgi:hypothetical protein
LPIGLLRSRASERPGESRPSTLAKAEKRQKIAEKTAKARPGASLRRAAPFPYDLPPMRGNARSAAAFVFDKKGRRFVSSKIVAFLRSDIGLTGAGSSHCKTTM